MKAPQPTRRAPTHRIALEVTLCDDLHSGTGLGGAGTDDLIGRDRAGRPVIRWSHLKGLLVQALLDRAAALGESDIKATRERLFGKEDGSGAGRGIVIGRSLRFKKQANGSAGDTLVIASTARRPGSRVPQDDTLRRIEYLRAGTTLAGEIRVRGCDDKHEDVVLVRALIRRMSRLGGRRTRGAGRVHVKTIESSLDVEQPPTAPDPAAARMGVEQAPAEPGQPPAQAAETDTVSSSPASPVKLVLKALEPVCLAAIAQPGNEIPSHTHIPPAAVMGALARWAIVHGFDALADDLLEGRIVPGPGYPLPPGHDVSDVAQVDSIPIPLSLQSPKPAGRQDAVPWWAEEPAPREVIDKLAPQPANRSGEKLKRPGADDYLVRSGNSGWSLFTCPLAVSMRNDAGTSQRKRDKQNLFSLEEVPEDTLFVVCIHAAGAQRARLLDTLQVLKAGAHWLSLGRAGAPVAVIDYADGGVVAAVPQGNGTPTPGLRLYVYVESDLILRDAKGRFHARLDAAAARALLRAAGVGDEHASQLEAVDAVSEPFEVRGWNAATGKPRFPALAIRRGSVAVLTFRTAEAAEAARTALGRCGPAGLGERRNEGQGRVRVGFPASVCAPRPGPDQAAMAQNAAEPPDANPVPENTGELHLRKALELLKKAPKGFTTSRWQALREAAGSSDRVEAWRTRAEHALKRRGEAAPAAWLNSIEHAAPETLRALAMLATRRLRRSERGGAGE